MPIRTDFGTFYGTNLTPDPEHGLGAWTEADFRRAMQRGRGPDGPLYPAFPFPSFTRMTDADLGDLWAFLQTLPPVAQADRPHEVKARYRGRFVLGLWRLVAFRDRDWAPDPHQSELVNRGAYLGTAVGHCAECHTDRGWTGRVKWGRALSGTTEGPEPGPNLTPHADGLGAWTASDLDAFLQYGVDPDGDVVGGAMFDLVDRGTAPLPAEDRAAIAAWLRALEPRPSRR